MKASLYLWSTIIGLVFHETRGDDIVLMSHPPANLEVFSSNPQVYYTEPPDRNRCKKKFYEIIAEGLGTNPSMFQTSTNLNKTMRAQDICDVSLKGDPADMITLSLSAGNLDITSDLMTGFISSRLMGMAFGEIAAQMRDAALDSDRVLVPRNFVEIACKAADASAKLDFDPPNTFCNLANWISIFLMCETTNTDICDPTPNVPIPSSSNCPTISSEWTQPSAHLELNKIGGTDGISLEQAAQDESPMYYMLFRALDLAEKENICVSNEKYVPNLELMPGWEKQAEFRLQEEGDDSKFTNRAPGIPIASLSQRKNLDNPGEPTCEFLLLIRAPRTSWELRQGLSAQLDPLGSISDILVHRGLNFMSTSLVTPIITYMNDAVFGFDHERLGPCSLEKTKIMIAGNSLGGGIGHLIGLKLSTYYGEQLNMDLVTFGAPNSMNKAGYDYLMKRVNMRSITNAMDPVPHFPCANEGMFRCSAKSFMILDGVGRDSPYGKTPNKVEINMEKLVSMYSKLGTLLLSDMSKLLRLKYWHTNPYGCYFGQYCNGKPVQCQL